MDNNLQKIVNSRFGLLLILLFIGLGLLLFGGLVESLPNVVHTLVTHIGVAFIVVFLLGLTVDWFLKRDIVVDVFKAAIGWILPDELKAEMEWVYSQRIVAIKHVQWCEIKPLKENLVAVNITVKRTLENVSNSKIEFPIGLGIDEWFHEGNRSRIIEFGWRDNDKDIEYNRFECIKGKRSLDTKQYKVSLKPKGTLDTWSKYTETKHVNDEHTLTHIYATKEPLVHVKAFEGIEIEASSVQHYQMSLQKVREFRYKFNGTLLPGHPITIRWWSIKDSGKWLKETKDKINDK